MDDMGDTEETTRTSATSSVSPKRKRPYTAVSEVWDHFKKVQKKDKSKPTQATCNYCFKEYEIDGNGTSTLWRHLRKCPEYSNKDANWINLASSSSSGYKSNVVFSQDVCRKELARMIIVDELPFCFVEKEGFKRFVQVLQPRFKMVSRTTIRKDCIEIYKCEKEKLKECLGSAPRVCLTTDLWTSIQNLGYMCLTAHYIDRDWKLQKKIINFCVLPAPHRGENIAQAVDTCLLEWGIKNVCTLTVDNASSNDKAAASLRNKLRKRNALLLDGKMLHVRCFAHIVNLIVKDGINEVGDSIVRVRDSVKYVRSSPSRLQLFKKCVKEEKIKSQRSLALDVQTRWNSTYFMLTSLLDFQKAFERLEEQDANFAIELGNGKPTENDWVVVNSLHKFLDHFYTVTKRISGSNYVTANLYFHEVNMIQTLLHKWSKSENNLFCGMAKRMIVKFDKYCNIDKVNKLLIIAVILDPRYKLKYVKFCFSKFYTSSKVDELLGNVKDVMDELYEYYSSLELASMDNDLLSQDSLDIQVEGVVDSEVIYDENIIDWQNFLKAEETKVIKSDLELYLNAGVENAVPNFDILGWWKVKASTNRALSHMARDILAIPVSTVASESAFSTGGRVLDRFRSSLTPKIVECLICGQDWLRSDSNPVEVEECLQELEELEKDLADEIEGLTIRD